MKIGMKMLLVGIALTEAVHCRDSQREPFSREFRGDELSFSSRQSLGYTGSFFSNQSITSRCIICALLCTPSAQTQDNADCVELAELCYFCSRSQGVEGKSFVCGHVYAEHSCVETAPEDMPCPTCRMYQAAREGDLSTVQELLMFCAPKLHRIVFPHGRERKSLINVCMDAGRLAEAMSVLLALLVKNLVNSTSKHIIPVSELALIVLRACPQTTAIRWQSLRLVMVSLAQCPNSEAAKFFCSCLEKMDLFQQITGWYNALESTLNAAIPRLPAPQRHSQHSAF